MILLVKLNRCPLNKLLAELAKTSNLRYLTWNWAKLFAVNLKTKCRNVKNVSQCIKFFIYCVMHIQVPGPHRLIRHQKNTVAVVSCCIPSTTATTETLSSWHCGCWHCCHSQPALRGQPGTEARSGCPFMDIHNELTSAHWEGKNISNKVFRVGWNISTL